MKYPTNYERMAFALGRLSMNAYRGQNIVIAPNVTIGQNVIIKSNAVIGEKGFGFERDENWTPIRIDHSGGVVIGDHVEIGAATVIAGGTIDPTIIEDHVKIDDRVFIAHNCRIGEKTLIIAGTCIGGSAIIGKCCWLGINCTIQQKIKIGNYAFIGSHANVTKDVPDYAVMVGNPAKILRYQTPDNIL